MFWRVLTCLAYCAIERLCNRLSMNGTRGALGGIGRPDSLHSAAEGLSGGPAALFYGEPAPQTDSMRSPEPRLMTSAGFSPICIALSEIHASTVSTISILNRSALNLLSQQSTTNLLIGSFAFLTTLGHNSIHCSVGGWSTVQNQHIRNNIIQGLGTYSLNIRKLQVTRPFLMSRRRCQYFDDEPRPARLRLRCFLQDTEESCP